MQRRNFLKNIIATGGFASVLPGITNWADKKNYAADHLQYYELKKYNLNDTRQLDLVNDYLSEKYLPALNSAGVSATGVFRVMDSLDQSSLFLLIPYESLEHFNEVKTTVDGNLSTNLKSSEYLSTDADSPPYQRMESSFMVAFEEHPILKNPKKNSEYGERIYELRTYESYNELKANKKVEMFNSGEIDVFNKTGLHTVFFGQKLIGEKLPNLTYMLHFENMEERDKNWKAFIEHPEWKKISNNPQYKNTVSNITQIFLKPTDYSQI